MNSDGYMVQWINDTYDTGGSTRIIKTLYDNNGNIVQVYEDTMRTLNCVDFYLNYKCALTKRTISRQLVPTTEERLEGYIQDNCDRYVIHEYGSYIYQMIQEKAYDFASEVVEEAKNDDYMIDDEESVIETIMQEIDFDSLYDLVEDILHAPITMEEKLTEVGMSIRDFL